MNLKPRLTAIIFSMTEARMQLDALPESPRSTQIASVRRILCAVTAKLEVLESELSLEEERQRK
jgi:hypothetical protein